MENHRLIFIPTYNERANVEEMHARLAALDLNADFLFIDDNSPDGTGEILDRLAAADPRTNVIHRPRKLGIGTAHLQAIRWAYDRGYAILMSFDCDFTHRPEYLPRFLEVADGYDLVIGSRYLGRDGIAEWNFWRAALTRTAHFLTRRMLGLPYDATTSFRLYQLSRIPRSLFDAAVSTGYAFFFETTYLMHLNGVRICETPVTLPARSLGTSKMGPAEIAKSVAHLLRLFALARSVKRSVAAGKLEQRAAAIHEP